MAGGWTVEFYRRWRPFLTLPSVLRLRNLAIRDRARKLVPNATVRLQFRHPFDTALELREVGTDLFTLEEILLEGIYGKVAACLPDCKTIVDLGANIGLATLYFAARCPGSRVVSVEPHPETFAVLSRNVRKLVASNRCFPLQAAIWSSSGRTLALSVPEPGAFNGVTVGESESAQNLTARSMTMPEILDRHGIASLDLLKVDIEGAEVELFRGDISWLERVRAIAIEFHGDSRKISGFDAAAQRFGFKTVDSSLHTVLVVR